MLFRVITLNNQVIIHNEWFSTSAVKICLRIIGCSKNTTIEAQHRSIVSTETENVLFKSICLSSNTCAKKISVMSNVNLSCLSIEHSLKFLLPGKQSRSKMNIDNTRRMVFLLIFANAAYITVSTQ